MILCSSSSASFHPYARVDRLSRAPTDPERTLSPSAADHVTRHLLMVAAFSVTGVWASAGGALGPPCASHGPEALLYISQPLWSHGKTPRVYGLRLAESRSLPFNLPTSALEAPHRTQLLNLQIRPQQDVRLE